MITPIVGFLLQTNDDPIREEIGRLQRNFQGMTTGKQCELLGLGPSAISQLEHAFVQNWKSTAEWRQTICSSRQFENSDGTTG